jgi:hypothetical protein
MGAARRGVPASSTKVIDGEQAAKANAAAAAVVAAVGCYCLPQLQAVHAAVATADACWSDRMLEATLLALRMPPSPADSSAQVAKLQAEVGGRVLEAAAADGDGTGAVTGSARAGAGGGVTTRPSPA